MRQQFTPPPELDSPDWLREQYASRSLQSIADELGVNRNTVRNRMIAFGIDRRGSMDWVVGKPKSAEQKAKMSEARKRYWERNASPERRDEHRVKVSRAKTKTGTRDGRPYLYVLGRGYVAEHVLVAEQKIGGPIPTGFHVHHIDDDRTNNHPDNLEVLSAPEHALVHIRQRERDALGRIKSPASEKERR